MSFQAHLRRTLEQLDTAGLIRRPRTIQSPQGTRVRIDGRSLLCFSSNNYLGLADHPELIAAARSSLDRDGFGAAASRLITGTMDAHLEAEAALAGFFEREAALLFSSGYAANVGTISALADADTLLLSDALNHASLIDGARLSRAKVAVYRHADVGHVEALLEAERGRYARTIIVTDALFSMDGDFAPLAALRELADRYDAWLVVDEAHCVGTLGPRGQGYAAQLGVQPEVLIGTLGKSFGAAGAFVAGSRELREVLLHRARSYFFSTAPLPLLARVAAAAVPLVGASDARRASLARNSQHLRGGLRALGFDVPEGDSPIIPVLVGAPERAMALSNALYEAGFIAQAIRPPTVPAGTSRIRLVPIATHTPADLDALIDAFARL